MVPTRDPGSFSTTLHSSWVFPADLGGVGGELPLAVHELREERILNSEMLWAPPGSLPAAGSAQNSRGSSTHRELRVSLLGLPPGTKVDHDPRDPHPLRPRARLSGRLGLTAKALSIPLRSSGAAHLVHCSVC